MLLLRSLYIEFWAIGAIIAYPNTILLWRSGVPCQSPRLCSEHHAVRTYTHDGCTVVIPQPVLLFHHHAISNGCINTEGIA